MLQQLRTKTMLLLGLLLAGASSAWAEEETITLSQQGYSNAQNISSTEGEVVTLTYVQGSATTAPTYYNTGTGVRVYAGGKMTVTASNYEMTKVVVTHTQEKSPKISWSTEGTTSKTTTNTTATWEGSATSVDFNVTSAGHARIQKVVVTYVVPSDPNAPSATLSETSLDFGKVNFGQTKEMTFTVTPANLTSDLTISCDNDKYEVSPITIASTETTAQTITVTAKPTALNDDMDGTITISGGGLDAAKTVTLTTTVSARESVLPEGGSGGSGYTLVTDASTLAAGDQIIIVNEDYSKAMSAQNGNFRSVEDVTITDHTISTISSTVAVLTLEGSTGAWYFHASDGYLYASSKSSNNMGTENNKDDNAKATISIDSNGNATIVFQGTNTHNNMKYNNSYSRFSCYASTSTLDLPMIYRQNVATSYDITVGKAGWRTLVSAANVTLPEGLKAYIVTESTSETATLTEVASVKAGEPYLLKGEEGSYTLTIAETADEPTGNLLQVSTETTGNGVYVLANKESNGVGFYQWVGGSLGAGRVYLPAPAAARGFVGFGFDETTGIGALPNDKGHMANDEVYNLQGQRVTQPAKGLYIVNGKKVVMK